MTMPPPLLIALRVLWKRSVQERSCRWTRSELHRHQEERCASLRRYAMDHSQFYARFHRGMANRPLQDLPILTKATVMENFDELVTDPAVRLADLETFLKQDPGPKLFRDRYVVLATSGSTGRRGVFLFNEQEWMNAVASITRPLLWAGISRRFAKPPRTALIASTTSWHYSARIGAMLTNRMLPSLRLDAAEPVESMVRRLNEWQPENLAGYPSVLRQLAEEQIAGRLHLKLSSAATSAEVLTEETRRRAKEAWGIRIFDTYGATEYSPIAAECAHGRKHLFEDGAIIEVVDEKGRAVPSGKSGDRILFTVFNRTTQPLIRYEISDVVRAVEEPCPCGRPFRVIEAVEGRAEDVLFFPRRDAVPRRDGAPRLEDASGPVAVHPNVFHQALELVPSSGWQVLQDEAGLSVRITGLKDLAVCQQVEQSLLRLLEEQGAAVSAIRVDRVDVLERGASGKAPLILCRVKGKPGMSVQHVPSS
jgi:putative adenylate-forming enzyme